MLRSKVYQPYGHIRSGKKELIILNGNQLKEVVKVYENIKASYSTMVNTTSQYIVDLRLELAGAKLEIANKNTEIATLSAKVENLKLRAVLSRNNIPVENVIEL